MNKILIPLIIFLFLGCNQSKKEEKKEIINKETAVSLVVLGTIQDAGSPHIACKKECCRKLFDNPDKNRQVVALGVIDNENNERYLFEATPDIARQVKNLKEKGKLTQKELPNGVFLTHAHIGHYTGLMYFGKEATNAKGVPVYAMPKMKTFLEENGPWSQLVTNKNIVITQIENEQEITMSSNLKITPLIVPHRDEYSETVGYRIKGNKKSALFIPDIDKWEKWSESIINEIKKVDFAFLDATFYSGEEINTRDISQIPHPFIIESMEKFKKIDKVEKEKIYFIHFNHTNPVINLESKEAKIIIENGFNIAELNQTFSL